MNGKQDVKPRRYVSMVAQYWRRIDTANWYQDARLRLRTKLDPEIGKLTATKNEETDRR